MKIKIYQDFNEELKSHWKRLEEESYITPFQSYSWLLNWYKTTGFPLHNIDLLIPASEKEIGMLPDKIQTKK